MQILSTISVSRSFSSRFCFSANSFENSFMLFPSQANFVSQQIPSKISLCFSFLKQFFFSANSIDNFFLCRFLLKQILFLSKFFRKFLCFFLLKQVLFFCKFLRKFLCAFSFSSKFCFSANSFENSFVLFPSQTNFASLQIPSKIPLSLFFLKQILLFGKFLLKFDCT